MKIAVFSDSHGNLSHMVRVTELLRPDQILHLGDGWKDAQRMHGLYPEIPMTQVPGNCDFRPTEEAEQLLCIGGKRILLCHGHTLGVKQSLLSAAYAAEERHADLFLFGHTHRPLRDVIGGTLFLNPGSIGEGQPPTYGVVRIEDGTLTAEIAILKL